MARKGNDKKDKGKAEKKGGASDPKQTTPADRGNPPSTPVATSEMKRTPIHSQTTPAGVMSEATARAAASTAPSKPSHTQIAQRAYEIWCAEGCPDGREHDHWFAAERSLIVELKPESHRPVRG